MTYYVFFLFRKLKRDSAPYESDISETDKLLIQKDEEVIVNYLNTVRIISLTLLMFQIRRMQEMLKQMQEKLKVDAQDINKKHDSIINV